MRAVIVGLAGLLIAGDALAADYLRGSTYDPPARSASYNWSGVYVGGHVGRHGTSYDFTESTRPVIANILRQTMIENEANVSEWANLPSRSSKGTIWGGFVGYNSQWGDVVVGLELNYSRVNGPTATSSDTIGRTFETSDEFLYDVFVTSNASARLRDLGSLRLRMGYAWGWLMPYGMVGLAGGRADAFRSATVDMTSTDASDSALDPTDGIPPRPGILPGAFIVNQSETKNGIFRYGYMFGVGVDIGLFPGVFLRGEWEFAQLGKVLGIPIQVNTFRVGAGVKF